MTPRAAGLSLLPLKTPWRCVSARVFVPLRRECVGERRSRSCGAFWVSATQGGDSLRSLALCYGLTRFQRLFLPFWERCDLRGATGLSPHHKKKLCVFVVPREILFHCATRASGSEEVVPAARFGYLLHRATTRFARLPCAMVLRAFSAYFYFFGKGVPYEGRQDCRPTTKKTLRLCGSARDFVVPVK